MNANYLNDYHSIKPVNITLDSESSKLTVLGGSQLTVFGFKHDKVLALDGEGNIRVIPWIAMENFKIVQ